ncbi:RusA family crossover junction endodeoxyribonuclease [Lactococcus raffinolactis]|nr:RusA family crossover junction endodeoxyribonuclease [Lactococcus raffinolactis]
MHWRSLMVVINLDPYPSPRPRFSRRGTYMPSDYTAWKKMFLREWLKHNLGKYETGVAIAVDLKFYIKPPLAISKVKKNKQELEDETIIVVKKPDLDNLEKSVLDSINGHAYEDDNQISDLHSRKRYSLNPRVEIEIMEDVEG